MYTAAWTAANTVDDVAINIVNGSCYRECGLRRADKSRRLDAAFAQNQQILIGVKIEFHRQSRDGRTGNVEGLHRAFAVEPDARVCPVKPAVINFKRQHQNFAVCPVEND